MKIGINVSFLRKINTGIGQYTLNIVKEILKLESGRNNQYFLYCEDKDNLDLIPEGENIHKKVIKTPFYKRDDLVRKTTWERVVLVRQAKTDGVEVFFTPYNSVSYFPLIRHVVTLHDVVWKVYEKDYINNFRKSIYAKQSFEAVRRSSHIITVSEYSKKEIIKYLEINPMHITVIKNGIAGNFKRHENQGSVSRQLSELGINSPYIFYIGGFEKRKNVSFLLKSFKKIIDNYPNVIEKRKLVIAGEIWEHKDPLVTDVEKDIKELNLGDRVIVLGKVKDKEKIILYNGAELFVFPSFYEGFGMPVLEAMACGCPIITSNRTSIPEVGGDALEYFNPDREDEFIQHLNRLLADQVKRSELSQKGLNRAREFSWGKAAQKTLEILTN